MPAIFHNFGYLQPHPSGTSLAQCVAMDANDISSAWYAAGDKLAERTGAFEPAPPANTARGFLVSLAVVVIFAAGVLSVVLVLN